MYDHISSGLEHEAECPSFDEALKNYITREFGGIPGLHRIERQYRAAVLSSMKQQYFDNILQIFRSAQVILLAIAAVAVYCCFSASWFSGTLYLLVFLVLGTIKSAIKGTRYIRVGYVWRSTKSSIKDDGFKLFKYIPAVTFVVFAAYHALIVKDTPAVWISGLNPIIPTVIFMVYALHILSFYKMYTSEFKVDVAC